MCGVQCCNGAFKFFLALCVECTAGIRVNPQIAVAALWRPCFAVLSVHVACTAAVGVLKSEMLCLV